jgi:small nuclear ribonucleoprotein (snRNP)-like protein
MRACRSRRNPLQEIMDAVTSGPLLLLKRACADRARVRVVTRHSRGVRGTAVGTLVAFDKYMNLVLRDVEEDYTVLLRLEREQLESGKLSRGRRKQERRRRSLKQVFVRGDSVVCVQLPPAG